MRPLRLVSFLVLPLMTLLAVADERVAPQTLAEAFAALDNALSADERSSFRRKPEAKAVADEHLSLGLMIRNEWLRTKGSRLALELRDAGARSFDDASSMVLRSYWRHLNGLPIELEVQGECYRRWSEEQRRLETEATAKGQSSYASPSFSCSEA